MYRTTDRSVNACTSKRCFNTVPPGRKSVHNFPNASSSWYHIIVLWHGHTQTNTSQTQESWYKQTSTVLVHSNLHILFTSRASNLFSTEHTHFSFLSHTYSSLSTSFWMTRSLVYSCSFHGHGAALLLLRQYLVNYKVCIDIGVLLCLERAFGLVLKS